MLDALAGAFSLFASVDNLLAIVIGVAIGTFVGAIPGMTGTLAVALALPFTFYMPPVTAILLLVGIYKGSFYGGSIPAILIRSPGTPAAACTALDGYPLSQQGKAGKALNMALYASCCADLISNIALFFFAALIASYALRFGPPEFFALICFALTITAGVSGNSLLRGMVAAMLGLLLATIGQDLVYGSPRMHFGEPELMGGLNFIPVLIGLFAIPEIINMAAKRGGVIGRVESVNRKRVTWAEFRQCLPSIGRGGVIGVILGAIPGIGGAPAAFLSYSEAKRTSKEPEKFGKGSLEGVAASEAGNNGVCGATLIPLLALGIPGDVITAIILGAFMIHGIAPGPQLFEGNITMVYAIFMGILASSAVLFIIGKGAISAFGKIAEVPRGILLPVVLVLCAFGAYGVNNTMFDVLVMMIMGVVGYIMLRLYIPAAPFLIAFILGPMFEDNLRRSLLTSQGSPLVFFRSGISTFFLALTVVAVVLILRSQIRKARQQRHHAVAESRYR